jgi:hypothetical protein
MQLTLPGNCRVGLSRLVASRAGYPTAMLASFDECRCLSNYHLMSDTPENLDYDTVAAAVTIVDATARALAAH